jgi:NADPH2:quinone reductase
VSSGGCGDPSGTAVLKALLLLGTGGPEQFESVELPEPLPGPGEILVDARAASINFVDILIRQGRYPLAPEFPAVLGMEVAGEVIDCGEESGFEVGDRVMALTLGGRGFAERVAVPARMTYPLPDRADFVEGSAFLMAFLTAFLPLSRQLSVGPGTTLLIHGAGGGVGTAAVQIGRQLGATVIATAGSQEKLDVAAKLGAAVTVDHLREDFAERVREATGGDGVDAVFDPVGGAVFEQSIGLLRPFGALVAIGYVAGAWSPLDPGLLVGRNIGLHGFYLARLAKLRPQLVSDAVGQLSALWRDGAIRPHVGAVYPLDEGPAAHSLVEERRSIGKVVLVP